MPGDTIKLTKAHTDSLIDHVRDKDVLHNLTHKDYHRDDIKRNNWIEIAEKMGIDDSELIFYLQDNASTVLFLAD